MLRISEDPPSNQGTTLRLEGRMAGPWVAEVRRVCEDILAAGRVLKLNLAEVEFLDSDAVSLLSSLRARGVEWVDSSVFVEAQLRASLGQVR